MPKSVRAARKHSECLESGLQLQQSKGMLSGRYGPNLGEGGQNINMSAVLTYRIICLMLSLWIIYEITLNDVFRSKSTKCPEGYPVCEFDFIAVLSEGNILVKFSLRALPYIVKTGHSCLLQHNSGEQHQVSQKTADSLKPISVSFGDQNVLSHNHTCEWRTQCSCDLRLISLFN